MTVNHPPLNIGLLWHSMHSGNLGVGALTLANMAIAKDVAAGMGLKLRFTILGWKDPGEPYFTRDDISIVGLRMKDFVKPTGLYAAARRCDLVLDIGAGDSFTDIYGAKRFSTMLASKILVWLARRPLVLSPQTIGPFNKPLNKSLALRAMNRADAVATRDDLSTRFLRDMGYKRPIIEATDVAMRLPYDPPAPRSDGKIRVGINVSGLLMNGGYTRANMFGLCDDYPALMRRILQYFAALPDVDVFLVPHVLAAGMPVEDDWQASEMLVAEFPGSSLSPRFASPSDAKSWIAGCDFFMGARMHACIAAFSSGVPVIPMAYSRKFAGLFGTLGYDATVDLKTESNETVLERIRHGFESREALRTATKEAFGRALLRLGAYEDALMAAMQAAIR